MSVCLEDNSWENKVYLAIGLYINGCKPVFSNCLSEIFIEKNKVILKTRGLEINICFNGINECSIVLNKEFSGLYQHILKQNNLIESYITTHRVDPLIFTGMFICDIIKGYSIRDSFNKVFEKISITNGDSINLFTIIYSEYICFNKLIDVLRRLMSSVLANVFKKREIILGCRTLDKHIYVTKMYYTERGVIQEPIEKLNIEEYSDYSVFPQDNCFICIEKTDLGFIEKYDYRVVHMSNYSCIISKDLINTISLLENIYG